MQLKVYSIFDKKVGTYSIPMYFPHEAYAVRALRSIVADPETHVGRHPADFDVHVLGTFDDNTGQFTTEGSLSIGSCVQFLPVRADTLPLEDAAQ